tara:strand:+ start:1353 stop:1562 length:210 start_codon:yes stop_codon:yes gene_type:complete
MKIKITRDCAINGEHNSTGTVIDLPDDEAIEIINMGKATPSGGQKKTEDRAVGLTTESAAPIKKRVRKK